MRAVLLATSSVFEDLSLCENKLLLLQAQQLAQAIYLLLVPEQMGKYNHGVRPIKFIFQLNLHFAIL